MTQKQNGVLEWLQSCETPAPSEPKIKAVIVAGIVLNSIKIQCEILY